MKVRAGFLSLVGAILRARGPGKQTRCLLSLFLLRQGWRRKFCPCLAEEGLLSEAEFLMRTEPNVPFEVTQHRHIEPSMKGASGEGAHQLEYLAGLRRSCVMRCVILRGEHARLYRAHDFEGSGKSEHQLAEFLATVKMHATEFIGLSLLM